MAENSKIEWCDHTFNPWIGCTKVSAGCAHCYAEAMDHRFGGGHWGKGAQRRETSPGNWRKPLTWNRKAYNEDHAAWRAGVRPRVFCASLADVFDLEVPNEWRHRLFMLIHECTNLRWLLLTKRPGNAAEYLRLYGECTRTNHVWIGTSVEDQATADERIPQLLQIPAAKRFLSCEPLLGPMDLSRWMLSPDRRQAEGLGTVDWVIAGGESGSRARPMHPTWVRSLRDQCQDAGVPFFFKQWGEWAPLRGTGLPPDPVHEDEIESDRPWCWVDYHGGQHECGGDLAPTGERIMERVGKRAAGRELDGQVWDEVPE